MFGSLRYLARGTRGMINGSQLKKHAFDIAQPSIKLNKVEQKICRLLNDYTALFNAKQENVAEPLTLRISGGWVRDKLLGQDSHDLDIAINIMSGEQFALQLNEFLTEHYDKYELEPHSINKIDINPEKSKHLETATTKLYEVEIDFVNLRSEEYSDHSRIPVVNFGTAEEDAFRRDATLNALFYNITQDKIEDFTKLGLYDLNKGILRTPLPPRQTFLDDPLRVLRLIRFAARYNFEIEPNVYKEMQDPEINDAFLHKISNERIGVEVQKILRGPNPLLGLSLIQSTKIDNVVFRWHEDQEIINFNETHCENFNEIERLYSSGKLNAHLERVISKFDKFFSSSLPFYSNGIDASADFAMNTILSCCLIPMAGYDIIWTSKAKMNNKISLTESILKNWLKVGKNESTRIAKVVNSSKTYDCMVDMFYRSRNDQASLKRSDLGIFLRDFKGDWETVHYVSLFNHFLYSQQSYYEMEKKYKYLRSAIYNQNLENAHQLKPLLNGKEVLQGLNRKAGPWLGKVNEQAIYWQFDNPNGTKAELLEYMKSIAPKYV
ncbi:hypothetical protein HG535_0G04710 [Zygotorulaspora mrakii]|uniref:CCA tRNA nucleotidyltransferase, mitochondrial n=1 Tax=Zygotorulaspora mrakii TaxID=42260 RepID=A0A7H9B781_ZYGMR|nr:uncharacterized protein HG535_0G04710 [Zygotorulaspora mrakii]QLG74588.1 hypothetical protein HG535_0G04710 [Zygotorulaspora mrakii]